MKVDEHTTATRRPPATASQRPPGGTSTAWIDAPTAQALLEQLADAAPRVIARAPAAIHLIGGLSDYTGSAVAFKPVAEHACVAAQLRHDGKLTIRLQNDEGQAPTSIPLNDILRRNGTPFPPDQVLPALGGHDARSRLALLGSVAELLRANAPTEPPGGLLLVAEPLPSQRWGRKRETPLLAAAVLALATALQQVLDPFEAAALCHRVELDWLGDTGGIAGCLGALLGRPNQISLMQCDPHRHLAEAPLPEDLAVIGIDCGTVHPNAKARYDSVRTASFMGRLLIDRIVEHDRPEGVPWDGYLASVSVDAYVEHLRDRIPTKLKGSEFLERFGETGDTLTRIDPNTTYKVRSRTEHHVYEHARAQQFARCLSRAADNGDAGPLTEAGELMYASHWSYGQRCGLGSIETDLLVSLIRGQKQADIFGAKITGCGCGGVVAVLMRPSDDAYKAVETAVRQYTDKTGRPVNMHQGSLPGAYVGGAVRL